MQKFTLFLFLTFSITQITQAQLNRCSTIEHEAILKAKDPNYEKRRQQIEEFTSKVIEKSRSNPNAKMGGVITIPVVIHVVYKTAAQNIPDERLFEQIDILNEDFRRLNADASDTPEDFLDEAADCEIEFCLAQVDPDGSPTSGILRVETDVTTFNLSDNVKFTADGGSDAWPSDTYLNFWSCNLGAFLLGYAQFPGGPDATDGVVIHFEHVGNNAAGYPYHLGRTATHEVGHWLNLYHIWGDDSNCTGSDLCGDTPNQKTETYGCPSFPKTDMCSPDDPGIMYMNYMDYSDDACMNMFSNNQKSRMLSLFEPGGDRYSMLAAEVCALEAFDAQAIEAFPGGNVCTTTVTPVVTIQNGGSETLTSMDIVYSIDGGATSTQAWTGSLETGEEEDVALPAITTIEGEHTITVTLENPNGNPDGDTGDNTVETDFTVALTGLALPLVQGFEDSGFPYDGYLISNPDGFYTWERTNDASALGSYSVYMNHYENAANGEIDDMNLPGYDFTDYLSAELTFDVAYALYTESGEFSDTLEILVSSDCGETWETVYKKYNPDLQTAPSTESAFEPDDDEWRKETIDMTDYLGLTQVYVKFRTISDYENNLYVDNINIDEKQPIAVNELDESDAFTLYPNPVSDWLNIEFSMTYSEQIEIVIYDVIGNIVYSESMKASAGMNNRTIATQLLNAGYYRLQIENEVRSANIPFVKL